MQAINSLRKYETLDFLTPVPHTKENLVISPCCFAEDGYEMYKELKSTCTAIVPPVKP